MIIVLFYFFVVDLDISLNIPNQSISERNIVMTTVYNILRILVLPTSQSRNEIIIYTLNKYSVYKFNYLYIFNAAYFMFY